MATMKTTPTISGPYHHENLSLFLLYRPDAADTSRYVTLEEALDQNQVVIHETGQVSELFIENLLLDKDVYIQAGEILKGGRQDRTLRVDFVVPAKSGRIPVPTFCVESGRWHRRGAESAAVFRSSSHYLSSKSLKMATKLHASQHAVWDQVAEAQSKLGASVNESVQSGVSGSSLELTLEHGKIKERQADFQKALRPLAEQKTDAIGFVFAINGQINTGEVYASHDLFRRLWGKLLDAAVVEAVAESGERPKRRTAAKPLTASDIERLLAQAETGADQPQSLSDRVCLHTKRTPKSVLFETEDKAVENARIHQNYIWGDM